MGLFRDLFFCHLKAPLELVLNGAFGGKLVYTKRIVMVCINSLANCVNIDRFRLNFFFDIYFFLNNLVYENSSFFIVRHFIPSLYNIL